MGAEMITVATVSGRTGAFAVIALVRRTTVRLLVAALVATVVLGAVTDMASARTVSTTLGQNDFVQACRDGGGTPKRVGSRVVQCTTADGTVVTCNFNSSPASCTLPFVASGSVLGTITDAVLEPVDTAPSGGGLRPGRVEQVNANAAVLVETTPVNPTTPVTTAQVETTEPVILLETAPPADTAPAADLIDEEVEPTAADDLPIEEERP